MRRVFLGAIGVLVLFVSCRKGIEPIGYFPNPLNSEWQVEEYHKTIFDNENQPPYPNHFPYLFKKIYDYSGKTVTEMDCSFNSVQNFYGLINDGFYHEFKVSQKGRMVYLINKQLPKSGVADTVVRVTLNAIGRPESIVANRELVPDDALGPFSITEHYAYRNNIVVAVQTDIIDYVRTQSFVDSLHYDNHGNLLSFFGNTFQYDYTRTATQQFYCEGYMGIHEPFYLLQYLGYFPEVNSPANVMINTTNTADDYQGPLTNHQFDRYGRLTGYDLNLNSQGHTTITWK